MPYLIVRESYLNNRQVYPFLISLLLTDSLQLPGGRVASQRGEDGHGEVLLSLRPEGREEQEQLDFQNGSKKFEESFVKQIIRNLNSLKLFF